MAKRTRKPKKEKEDIIKWYIAFGFSAFLIAAGVFWMFGIIYQNYMSSANDLSTKIDSMANFNIYSTPDYQALKYEPQFPVLAYVAITLVAVGAACFCVTKVFYEKSKR